LSHFIYPPLSLKIFKEPSWERHFPFQKLDPCLAGIKTLKGKRLILRVLLFAAGASILFLKALRRKLENNSIFMLIIFLIDEQSNPSVGGYACF